MNPWSGRSCSRRAGAPSQIVVSRERLRDYLLWGSRHYAYDLIHRGARIAYLGAVRHARPALLLDGASAAIAALTTGDLGGDRLPRVVAFIALFVVGLLLAGPIGAGLQRRHRADIRLMPGRSSC